MLWVFNIIGNAFELISDESKHLMYEKVAYKNFKIYSLAAKILLTTELPEKMNLSEVISKFMQKYIKN
jgi:hypothetical protein